MSIKIELAEFSEPYRTCGSCASNDNVVLITALRKVGSSTQGTQIALCQDCALKLRNGLNVYLSGDEQDG